MKKILILIAVLLSVYCKGQAVAGCDADVTTTLAYSIHVADQVTDTDFYFGIRDCRWGYSIQIVTRDSIRTTNLGVRLYGSNDLSTYTMIGDTLAIDSLSNPQGKFFTGTTWPYARGKVNVSKGDATDGHYSIYVRVK